MRFSPPPIRALWRASASLSVKGFVKSTAPAKLRYTITQTDPNRTARLTARFEIIEGTDASILWENLEWENNGETGKMSEWTTYSLGEPLCYACRFD